MHDLKTVTFDASQYQLVPRAVTEEMHVAAVRTIVSCTGNDDFPPRVWTAMLAAAPTPAAQSAGQEAVAWAVECTLRGDRVLEEVYLSKEHAHVAADPKKWVAGSIPSVEPLFRRAAPVNGGDLAQRLADAEADVQRLHKDKMDLLMKYEFCAERAADAPQEDANVIRDPFGCLKCEHRECGRYVDGSRYLCHAMRDNACARDVAITSPAKVGGDERERFEAYAKAHCFPLARIKVAGVSAYEFEHVEKFWQGWQARAALSADGGEDKRDAERYRWLVERFVGYDFDWMPSEPDAADGKSVAVFEIGREFRGSRDITASIDDHRAAKAKGE